MDWLMVQLLWCRVRMEKITSYLSQTLLHVLGLEFICGLKKGNQLQTCREVKEF